MPGAFLKGNSSFLAGTEFSVDELSRAWDIFGVANVRLAGDTSLYSLSDLHCTYYKLQNITILALDVTITPSTVQYTGVQNDTSFLYSGALDLFAQNANNKVPTEVTLELDAFLGAAPYHFQNNISVIDEMTAVFFDVTEDQRIASIHINGVLSPTSLIITLPSGFLPHHRYHVHGSIFYAS